MSPRDIVVEIYNAAQEIPEPYSDLSPDERRTVAELLTRFDQAEIKHGPLPYRDMVRPMLLSKGGRYDEALACTAERYRAEPSWETAVGVANAARRAGDWEQAAEMFAKGAAHDPKDVTCWLEVGDIRLEQERWAESLAAYEQALDKEPENQWALPSVFYCRYQLDVPGAWLASLREVANQEGCTCGMEDCLTSLFGGYGSSRGIERAEYLLRKLGAGV